MPASQVLLGHISGVHGVRGWVKLFSHTQPTENLLDYSCWTLRHRGENHSVRVVNRAGQGKKLIARIALDTDSGQQILEDRDAAAHWVGAEIFVDRADMPESSDEKVYWVDLVGCAVQTTAGVSLGTIRQMIESGGGNEVMQVDGDRSRLIPFVRGHIVTDINLGQRLITVDWGEDWDQDDGQDQE